MTRQEEKWLREYAEQSKQDYAKLVRRRQDGEPLQYILGEWEFYGYNFKVGKGVLIPRPETELLVDLAKTHKPGLTLDLCAGTGCVGIALAKETGCNVTAVEISDKAIYYLKQNIELNNVQDKITVIKADVLNPNTIVNCQLSTVNCLVNPPYISKSDMQTLQKEVAHEPALALYGGEDGLDFYREFFKVWDISRFGLFACEVGDGQARTVAQMLIAKGLSPKIKKDYAGIERIVYVIK